MAGLGRLTQTFTQLPWAGGFNSSVDPGVLPPTDLTIAENVVYTNAGSRLKRQGYEQFDSISDIPAVTNAQLTSNVVTLTFASALQDASPAVQRLVVGEKITVTSTDATINGNFSATATPILSISGSTLTYAKTHADVGSTATATITVVRSSSYIELLDYWRLNSNSDKAQLMLAFSDQGKLFKFDANGRRTEITPAERSTVTVTNGDTADNTNGDWFKIYDSGGSVGVYMKTSGGVDTPPGGTTRNIQVPYATGSTAAQIATAIQTTLDADSKFEAEVSDTLVTIIDMETGTRTDIADGTQATGWTFAVTSQGRSASAPFSSTITRASSLVMNERAIFAMDGLNNKPIYYRPEVDTDHYVDLGGTPPDCSILREHIGRLWTDDKTNKDLVHYCSTGNPEEWLGNGDSGALPIAQGDGDPTGISAIFPPFKSRLFVAKGAKLYQVSGWAPEEFLVEPVSTGIGAEGHKSVVSVDMDDVMFLSKKGIHSLSATAAHGDFQGAFISKKIQPTFNDWPKAQLDKAHAIYLPDLNCVALSVAEEDQTDPTALWFLDTQLKEWYTWPDIETRSLAVQLNSLNERKLVWGSAASKIYRYGNGDYTDLSGTAIRYKVRTGTIYVDQNPQSLKGFKSISFYFKPRGRFSFTIRVWVDNVSVQSRTVSDTILGDTLGNTFILGTSILGSNRILAPHTVPIDGVGRGLRFEIENANRDEQVEIYGYSIEYEQLDISQET